MKTLTKKKKIDFAKKIKDYFEENNCTFDSSMDEITIKDIANPAQIVVLNLNDLNEEVESVTYYSNYYTLGEDFLNFILTDYNSVISKDSEISIFGAFKGKLGKKQYPQALIVNNIEFVIDINKLQQNKPLLIDELVKDNIVICEIKMLDDLRKKYSTQQELEKQIDLIINSVLTYLSFSTNTILANPRTLNSNNYHQNQLSIEKFSFKEIKDSEPTLYFLSAETIEYPHLKFLEYYHVIEYYFLHKTMNEMDSIIRDLVTLQLNQPGNINETSYTKKLNELISYRFDKDFNKEAFQLNEIICKDIGYNLLRDLCSERKLDLNFLKRSIFNINDTSMAFVKDIYDDKKKTLNIIEDSVQLQFCSKLSTRIYKIRNYIVHTKKYENSDVFTPVKENFDELSNDIELIRVIAFALMTKK